MAAELPSTPFNGDITRNILPFLSLSNIAALASTCQAKRALIRELFTQTVLSSTSTELVPNTPLKQYQLFVIDGQVVVKDGKIVDGVDIATKKSIRIRFFFIL